MQATSNWTKPRLFAATLITLTSAGLLMYALHASFGPGSQRDNLRKAEAHIPDLMRLLSGDHRFSAVRIQPGTNDGGVIAVSGSVRNAGDAVSLQEIVSRSHPPVSVSYRFLVISE